MARNRKRAKERRTRTPQTAAVSAARLDEPVEAPGPVDAPEPLEHAAPDVELAEAQLAVGRPEPAEADPEVVEEPDAAEALEADDDAGDAEARPLPVQAKREPVGTRLVGFAQGSWRELQRVQWPDRRQVVQATSVVIGFVIVAGVFLGVADFLAGHLMNYILTGHFK